MNDTKRQIPAGQEGRFPGAEAELYRAGLCLWGTEYGNWGPVKHCKAPVESLAPGITTRTTYCPDHAAEGRENYGWE